LLGLAQEEFAAGRPESSARNVERIRSDYPTSALLPVAAFWAVRSYFEIRNGTEACRWLSHGLALSGGDIELQNQLNFYAPRCANASVESAPTSTPAATSPDTIVPVPAQEPAATPRGSDRFTVQVAAAGSEAAATATSNALRSAGYDPHIVREGGFIKVRVGRFATRAEAAAAASQVRAKMGGSPFVVEEQ
jgi:hypothetical protein